MPAAVVAIGNDEPSGSNATVTSETESGMEMTYDKNYNTLAPFLPFEMKLDINKELKIKKTDDRKYYNHIPTPWSVELSAVGLRAKNTITPKTKDTLALRLLESGKSDWETSVGWGLNTRLIYDLNERFTISAGIGYSQRKESFDVVFSEFKQELIYDSLVYYILFPFLAPQAVTAIDSTIFNSTHLHDINHRFTYHTLTLTAGAGYSIPFGRFRLEPGVNVNIDFYNTVNGSSNLNPSYTETKGDDYFEQSIQFGISGNLQLGYLLNEKITIFLNPAYRYNFSSLKTSPAFYDIKNNYLSLGCGIRYSIFKRQAAKVNMNGSEIVNQ